jgi:hypothetical protein
MNYYSARRNLVNNISRENMLSGIEVSAMGKFTRIAIMVSLAPILAGSTLPAMAQQGANQQTTGSVDATGSVSALQAEHRGTILTYQSRTQQSEAPAARYEYFNRNDGDCYVRYPSGENVSVPSSYCAR